MPSGEVLSMGGLLSRTLKMEIAAAFPFAKSGARAVTFPRDVAPKTIAEMASNQNLNFEF